MMITRELLKAEIDKVQDRYLDLLYRIIKALVNPLSPVAVTSQVDVPLSSWPSFIEQTYGSLADDPIERGDQGQYEVREAIE
jgi:hypothetical protein